VCVRAAACVLCTLCLWLSLWLVNPITITITITPDAAPYYLVALAALLLVGVLWQQQRADCCCGDGSGRPSAMPRVSHEQRWRKQPGNDGGGGGPTFESAPVLLGSGKVGPSSGSADAGPRDRLSNLMRGRFSSFGGLPGSTAAIDAEIESSLRTFDGGGSGSGSSSTARSAPGGGQAAATTTGAAAATTTGAAAVPADAAPPLLVDLTHAHRLLPLTNLSALTTAAVLAALPANASAAGKRAAVRLHQDLYCGARLHAPDPPGAAWTTFSNVSLAVYASDDIVSGALLGAKRAWESMVRPLVLCVAALWQLLIFWGGVWWLPEFVCAMHEMRRKRRRFCDY
jgi:hypothetical protein